MQAVITGAEGFIGRHLTFRLRETGLAAVIPITRQTLPAERDEALAKAEVVIHLAGVNRPPDPAQYHIGNSGATSQLCSDLLRLGKNLPIIFSSSTQAALDNPYGRSKRVSEEALMAYGADTGACVAYFRFTNVFGKWARPNYNSAVATFCHNIARGLPITVHDPTTTLQLLYVDDAVASIEALLRRGAWPSGEHHAGPVYETTVGGVVDQLRQFHAGRKTRAFGPVGVGLTRALYATYVSYLPFDEFTYPLVRHEDARGAFAEMLRTPNGGQVSFFTAEPGVTRGGHYHHTKTEKFLVVQGRARFGFRHIITKEKRTLEVEGAESRIVETVPGWAHDITNIGSNQLIVLLWANELFDPTQPDTIPMEVNA